MNFILKNNKVWKIVLVSTLISFLWINTFGLVYHMDEMKMEGAKSNCLFGGQTDGCAMNFSEHITIWYEMFTLIPQNIIELINILILLILVITIIFWKDSLHLLSRRIASRFRLYIREHSQINLFNYLREVFSSGILNTKIYETVKI